MKKSVVISALVVGVLLTGSLVLAGPGSYGRGNCDGSGKGPGAMSLEQHEERMDHRLDMMGAVLDLSDEQKTQFETLMNQQWQQHQKLREQMQASREEMRAAQSAATFNEADYRAKAARHAELKTEMMVDRAKLKQKMYSLLTPEQQEKAGTLGDLMGNRGHGRHGGGGFGF